MTLTTEHLVIDCKGAWSRTYSLDRIRIDPFGEDLELRDSWSGTLLFRLITDEQQEWKDALSELEIHIATTLPAWDWEDRRALELEKLLDMSSGALRKLYKDIQEEKAQFETRNVRFNLDVQRSLRSIKSRKVKAFIVAHSYVAWYEWTRRFLEKIYKAKFGKGPETGRELMEFLNDYPICKNFLDTARWGMEPNQMRNCISHEKFYFDYRSSEIVFMQEREIRVRLRDLEWAIFPMSQLYGALIRFLVDKLTKGRKISAEATP